VHSCLAIAEHLGKDTPQLSADEDLTRADGVALISDLGADAFPHLHHD